LKDNTMKRHKNTLDLDLDLLHADPLAASGEPTSLDDWLSPADATGPQPLDEVQRQLVSEHYQTAYQIAWRFARHHLTDVPVEELISEALFALTYAAGLFDPARGVPFRMYAAIVIRHRLIRVGIVWRRHERTNLASGECDPIEQEPFRPEEEIDTPFADSVCAKLRGTLPQRWYNVLWLHCTEGLTLEEIGDQLGVSKQRAQKIITQAMIRARAQVDGWGSVC
jgi:RNA polymerase sigma factor (sigma-70 family)